MKGRPKFTLRCIIPVPGFYDWPSGTKRGYFVEPNDRKILTFAGIFVEHENGGTFSVLTTEPNADIKPLHHRMAIYLEPKECEQWLDPGTSTEPLHALMKQWPEGRLKNYEVSTRVHDHRDDEAECIAPIKDGARKKEKDDGRGIPKTPRRNLFSWARHENASTWSPLQGSDHLWRESGDCLGTSRLRYTRAIVVPAYQARRRALAQLCVLSTHLPYSPPFSV